MYKEKIILASSSPRRIEMMKKHGFDPLIFPADIEETLPPGIGMRDAVMFLALKKCLAVEAQVSFTFKGLIIAADTLVYKDGIIGKPRDRSDALSMLQKIRNTDHFVATGVAISAVGRDYKKVFCDVTKVFCKDYSEVDLNSYLDTDEPYDKAGGYAIQGSFAKYIKGIEGDFNNVVGFPWDRIESEISDIFKLQY